MKASATQQSQSERRGPVQQSSSYPKLSMRTIEHLAKMITAENPLMPNRGGPKLVTFYNGHGSNDIYASGGGFRPVARRVCIEPPPPNRRLLALVDPSRSVIYVKLT